MRPFEVAVASLVLTVASFPLLHPVHALLCMLPLAAVESQIREAAPARRDAESAAADFVADSVLIAYWLGQPGAVVVLGLDGCVAGQITLPAARARALFGETL